MTLTSLLNFCAYMLNFKNNDNEYLNSVGYLTKQFEDYSRNRILTCVNESIENNSLNNHWLSTDHNIHNIMTKLDEYDPNIIISILTSINTEIDSKGYYATYHGTKIPLIIIDNYNYRKVYHYKSKSSQ